MNNPTESANHNTNHPLDKTVRFAPTSRVLTFKAIGTEDATKSYNPDDYERFLIERHRDKVTHMLRAGCSYVELWGTTLH